MNLEFYSSYIKVLKNNFPNISITTENIKNLISPHCVELPQNILLQANDIISTLYTISRKPEYQNNITAGTGEHDNIFVKHEISNASVLMAYDFHYDKINKKLKLIEINTNASAYLFSYCLYQLFNQQADYLEQLKNSFLEETKSLSEVSSAIIDENLSEQKMVFEFHMYNTLFKKWGWESSIVDEKDIIFKRGHLFTPKEMSLNFIYNRFCDFTFNRESSLKFKESFLNSTCIFSPNPKEYILLADKERLSDLTKNSFLNGLKLNEKQEHTLSDCLLKTFNTNHFGSIDELWTQRKNFFFKPKNQYGSKASYKGQSISKKVFTTMMNSNTTIQEYCPPDKINTEHGEFKYDLRFFAYKDILLMPVARLYKGQVTNFKSEGGGISRVIFR